MVESLTQRPVLATATLGYFDHAGGLNQFDERLVHRLEAHGVSAPTVRDTAVERYFSLHMLDALPFESFLAEDYAVSPSTPTRLLEEGDVIDLGDRVLEVCICQALRVAASVCRRPPAGRYFLARPRWIGSPCTMVSPPIIPMMRIQSRCAGHWNVCSLSMLKPFIRVTSLPTKGTE